MNWLFHWSGTNMSEGKEGQRENTLKDAIAELEQILHAKRLLCDDAIRRIIHSHQVELKALQDKAKSALNPP